MASVIRGAHLWTWRTPDEGQAKGSSDPKTRGRGWDMTPSP